MPERTPIDYETPKPSDDPSRPETNYSLLFYIVFVLVSVWLAFYILSGSAIGIFYGIFGIFAQVIVWVLTIDLHRKPENPADDMNSMRKILLGLGMAVCILSLLVRLFR